MVDLLSKPKYPWFDESVGAALQSYLVPIHKWPICPLSALREKFNPRNINHMPALNFSRALISTKFARAPIGARPFLDGHYLKRESQLHRS
jgi:hypothetical protein